MRDVGYAFISAYLKCEEAKIITASHINSLSRASSVQDVLEIIRETDIGQYLEGVNVKTFSEFDEYLWRYLSECLHQLEWFKNVPDDVRKILQAYIVKYDILNIKSALQSIFTNKKTQGIPIGIIYNNGLLRELLGAENTDRIIKLLNTCKMGNYSAILERYKENEEIKSIILIDAKLEGEYYRNLLVVTKCIKDGVTLSRVFNNIVDLINLQIILRSVIGKFSSEATEYILSSGYVISESAAKTLLTLKLQDIPSRMENSEYSKIVEEVINSYDRSKSVTAVDEIIDKHKLRLIKELLSPRVLSPLVIIWYLVLKEIEIRNVRMVLKAVFDRILPDEIKDYLALSS